MYSDKIWMKRALDYWSRDFDLIFIQLMENILHFAIFEVTTKIPPPQKTLFAYVFILEYGVKTFLFSCNK